MASKAQTVAPVENKNTLPAEVQETDALLQQYAGAGTSASPEHNTIPLIYVLQANSPQVAKRNPLYIEEAEAGDFWLRNAANPIVKGDKGLTFQPCHLIWAFTEWKPEREGFVQI